MGEFKLQTPTEDKFTQKRNSCFLMNSFCLCLHKAKPRHTPLSLYTMPAKITSAFRMLPFSELFLGLQQ